MLIDRNSAHRRSGAGGRASSSGVDKSLLMTQETGTNTTKQVLFFEGDDEEKRPTPNDSNAVAGDATGKRSEKKKNA